MRASFVITLILTASLVYAQEAGTTKAGAFYNAGGSLGPNSVDDAAGFENIDSGEISATSGANEVERSFSGANFQPGLGAAPGIGARFFTDGDGLEAGHTSGHGYFNPGRESPDFPVNLGESPSEQAFTASMPYEQLRSPTGHAIVGTGRSSAGNPDIPEEPKPRNVFETGSASQDPESASVYSPLVSETAPFGLTSESAEPSDSTDLRIPMSNGNTEDSDGPNDVLVGEHFRRRPQLDEARGLSFFPAKSPTEQDGGAEVYGSLPSYIRPSQFEDDVAIPRGGRFEDSGSDYTTGVRFSIQPDAGDSLESHTTYDDNGFFDFESPNSVEENSGGTGRHIFGPSDGLESSLDVNDVLGAEGNVARYSAVHRSETPNYSVFVISRPGGDSDPSDSREAPEPRKSIVVLQSHR
uniref:Uncharacterized protein n=1 Tax=Rhipicephalus appendiculatus TaxID=34631 RepID=A0A131YDB4_RHIAP